MQFASARNRNSQDATEAANSSGDSTLLAISRPVHAAQEARDAFHDATPDLVSGADV
jgi:hypothetical protein